LKSLTTSGSYLAARHASVERDAKHQLRPSTARRFAPIPKNNELMDARSFSVARRWRYRRGRQTRRPYPDDRQHPIASPRLVVGVRDLKQKKYATAQININQSIRGPITDLVATLLSGLGQLRRRRHRRAAVANIDKLTGPEWVPRS